MAGKAKPEPCFLDRQEKYKVVQGRQIWTNIHRTRFYTWDSMHGEIEVYDARGSHLGVLDAIMGYLTKPAVRGRKIDVK